MQGIKRSDGRMSSILTAAKRMARRYGQIGHQDHDDICQNAMLRVLNRTDDREVGMCWLFKTVRSTALDAGRSYAREARWLCVLRGDESLKSVCERADERGYLHLGGTYIVYREDAEMDLMPQLKNMLNGLNKPLRQVLVLHGEGYSYEEIAQMTNTKIGTVRSRLHYARKRAKCLLDDLG